MSNKPQAERCSRNGVVVHIRRQRKLGENMIGDNDRARWPELLASAVGLACILGYGAYKGYVMPWNLVAVGIAS